MAKVLLAYKAVVQNLPAMAVVIKAGGSAQLIKIARGFKTHGKNIFPLEQHGAVQCLIL